MIAFLRSSPCCKDDPPIDVLYFCEFTLNFYKTKKELERHQLKVFLLFYASLALLLMPQKFSERKCPRHPPGDEIYRRDNVKLVCSHPSFLLTCLFLRFLYLR